MVISSIPTNAKKKRYCDSVVRSRAFGVITAISDEYGMLTAV